MNKKIKILIIGFGSIGQRHYRNLLSLGYKNVWVYDVDARKTQKYKNTKTINNVSQKVLKQFDVVFVCNPNYLHIKSALLAARAGCHLFIEKPLSHSLAGVDKLIKICEQRKLVNLVACNMRFHPGLKFIKNYLAKKKLGKVYRIQHECGYNLAYWRPGTDYRKNYAAKKSMGGGIILDDIHEFDLLFWLNNFEPAEESSFVYNKASDLQIETEDNCLAGFKFKNKVLGAVSCDYLQQKYSRNCKVVGEKGSLAWDWQENVVWLHTKDKSKKMLVIKNYDLNQMYVEEMKYFFKCLDRKQKTFNDIKIARQVLKHCVERK